MVNIIAERVKTTTLTKSQLKIAEYFIRNTERIGSLTSLDAAREIGVSDASIIRFSRAIGFEGFADLKDNVYRMLVENAQGGLSLTERLARNAELFGDDDPAAFLFLMQQNLESVFRINAPEQLEKCAETLINAENRYVIGMRGCRGAAAKFGRLLSFLLPRVHTLLDGECDRLHDLQDISEKDAALTFVFSRFYRIDLDMARLIRGRGAKLCMITDAAAGPMTPFADILLRVETGNMSFFHSTIAAEMAGEYILKLIGDRTDSRERIDEIDRITQPDRL